MKNRNWSIKYSWAVEKCFKLNVKFEYQNGMKSVRINNHGACSILQDGFNRALLLILSIQTAYYYHLIAANLNRSYE